MADKDKITDIKKQEQERRTEIAMLYHLMGKYPREAKEKTRKLPFDTNNQQPKRSL